MNDPGIKPDKICSGMYAFTEQLQKAWHTIFDGFYQHLPAPYNHQYQILFEDQPGLFMRPDLFMGQTCGYPYVMTWQPSHDLVAVPSFNIPGCEGTRYSSWFICNKNSLFQSLTDFKSSVLVLNNNDSNSGMNVLRSEISKIAYGKSFFAKVLVSDSHLTSIDYVANGKADIASIDAVTWYFAIQEGLVDPDRIRIIGQSQKTAGLPFIINRSINLDSEIIRSALNLSLQNCPTEIREFIKIDSFEKVSPEDYRLTRKLEIEAINLGYPFPA